MTPAETDHRIRILLDLEADASAIADDATQPASEKWEALTRRAAIRRQLADLGYIGPWVSRW